jgi:hypothetical protein
MTMPNFYIVILNLFQDLKPARNVIPANAEISNRQCTIPRHAGLDPASQTDCAQPQQIPASAGMTTLSNQA